MRVAVAIVAGLIWSASPAWAQPRAITLDDLYDPVSRIDFSGGANDRMFAFAVETLRRARPAAATSDAVPGRR